MEKSNRLCADLLVSFVLMAAIVAIAFALFGRPARGGERVACEAKPGAGDGWHYRTKIPGYGVGIRDDKCWYVGPSMKARDELYWTDPKPAAVSVQPLSEFENRWRGMIGGGDQKE